VAAVKCAYKLEVDRRAGCELCDEDYAELYQIIGWPKWASRVLVTEPHENKGGAMMTWSDIRDNEWNDPVRAKIVRAVNCHDDLMAFVVECAEDRDDRVSGGIKTRAQVLIAKVREAS
jgi:hypothetical protein